MGDESKLGRPFDGTEPKSEQYRLRMTKEDMEKLEYCAKMKDISKADVLREGLYKIYDELND